MAEHLAMIEQQAERVGQQADHGQHHQSLTLTRGRLLQMRIRDDGVKDLRIDLPAAAPELVQEQRRDGAQFQVGGVEVGGNLFGGLPLAPRRSGLVADHNA